MAPFSCTNTIWYPVREGASGGQNLVLSYTGIIGQVVEFKVRISAAYNSSTGGYMYFDIHIKRQHKFQHKHLRRQHLS